LKQAVIVQGTKNIKCFWKKSIHLLKIKSLRFRLTTQKKIFIMHIKVFEGLMELILYLNNQVSEIIKITPRQVQHWTDKGVIIPAKEASRGGTKRGYNYLNLIEFGFVKSLYDKGQGIQSIKKILGIIRDKRIIEEWVSDHLSYFQNVWKTGGPFGLGHLDIDGPNNLKLKKILRSLQKMFLYMPNKSEKTGVLIYFFSGALNFHPCILPVVKTYEDPYGATEGSHLIYSFLTQYEAALIININQIKDDIDKALGTA
jgi:DNA-binding transcriptional MerR regulator